MGKVTLSGAGAVGAIIAILAWGVVAFLLGVAIINWNVNDIIQHGVNFWNVFWLSLVATVWFGTAKGAS